MRVVKRVPVSIRERHTRRLGSSADLLLTPALSDEIAAAGAASKVLRPIASTNILPSGFAIIIIPPILTATAGESAKYNKKSGTGSGNFSAVANLIADTMVGFATSWSGEPEVLRG
jgi:hypothetical protein